MKLLLDHHRATMLHNGREAAALNASGECPDHPPVVKLFTPDAGCTWLLSELDPDDPDIAFGLCDLGVGCPELGSVRISEIESVRGRFGLPVERDRHFRADHPMSVYVRVAQRAECISEDPQALADASAELAEEWAHNQAGA
jgi:hypothetical protein